MVRSLRLSSLLSAAMLVFSIPALAVPFDPDLTVSGNVTFNAGFFQSTPVVTLDGALTQRSGTVDGSAVFDQDLTPLPSNLIGPITDFGDGFGGNALTTTQFEQATAGQQFAFDIVLDLTNDRAGDQLTVTLQIDFANEVNADGTDAFANSNFAVTAGGSEVFSTDLASDTLNGDEIEGNDQGSFGAALSQGPDTVFVDVIIPALTTVQVLANYTFFGGAAIDISSASTSDFSAFISVAQIDGEGLPSTNVPTGGLPISLAIIALLTILRRRRTLVFSCA